MQVEQRAREQLGDAAAAVRDDLGADVQRTAVGAFHERDGGVGQQRAEQAKRRGARVEAGAVGVDKGEHVAACDVQRAPQRVALPARGAVLGEDLRLLHDRRAGRLRDRSGAVGRGGVDDEQLVEQSRGAQRRELREDRADRPGDLARGQHDADRRRALGGEQALEREVGGCVRAALEPVGGDGAHRAALAAATSAGAVRRRV